MNRLKSIFISLFISLAVMAAILSLAQLMSSGWQPAWLGVLITSLFIALFFANLYRFTTPRTNPRLPWHTAVVLLGTAVTFISVVGLAILLNTLLLAGWLVYLLWYSRLEREPHEQLVAGRPFPTIDLEDENGRPFSSTRFAGQIALYLFYRGNWCPLCMAQIREVAAQYQALAQRGAKVVLISPQPHKFTRNLAARLQVPFTFLVDPGNKAARQLGLDQKYGIPAGLELLGYASETVLPTVIIVGADGRIVYSDFTDSYRIRPEPAEFLRILDRLAEA